MLLMKECVLSLEKTTTQPWFTYLKVTASTKIF